MFLAFKTKKQKIEALEDAITDKEARLTVLKAVHEGATEISYFHLGKIEDLAAEISVLRNKLCRVTGVSSNAKVSGAGTASAGLPGYASGD
ncbi:MAG: hypothetical protein MOGMAGMI_01913 [Candidatus Omnitrophica bacterium]|nr:hypothetical protein [Candidatus Omnitrophota bacterium]